LPAVAASPVEGAWQAAQKVGVALQSEGALPPEAAVAWLVRAALQSEGVPPEDRTVVALLVPSVVASLVQAVAPASHIGAASLVGALPSEGASPVVLALA